MFVKRAAMGALMVTALCGSALSPASACAQRISELHTVSPLPLTVEPSSLERDHSPPIPQADREEKSTYVAGLLSLLLPGAGSFYAGNSAHGWTHLLIEAGTFGAGFLVAHTCNGELGCGIEVLTGVGVVLIANQVWSIVTAVRDVSSARNRAHDH